MKKIYLFFLIGTYFHLAKAINPVPNSSFENWTIGTTEKPDNWYTNTDDDYITVTKTTPGYNSPYAVKGQTAIFINYTRSPLLKGVGSGNGFTITQNYNNFEFYYKTKLISGDVFIASVLIEDAGHNNIGEGVDTIITSDSGFTKRDIDITYLNSNAAVSAIITFSLLHGPSSGNDTVSYFIVDDILLNTAMTGLQNKSVENKLNAFPIPAHDRITIKGQTINTNSFRLLLTDAIGRTMMERKTEPLSGNFIDEELNLNDIPPGIYFLILISDESILTRKIVIQ